MEKKSNVVPRRCVGRNGRSDREREGGVVAVVPSPSPWVSSEVYLHGAQFRRGRESERASERERDGERPSEPYREVSRERRK